MAQPIWMTGKRKESKDGMSTVEELVKELIGYGVRRQLITEDDRTYAANEIFDILGVEPSADFSIEPAHTADEISAAGIAANEESAPEPDDDGAALEPILKGLLDDAVSRGVIDGGIASRDLLDTRIMGALTPRPSEVIRNFRERLAKSPEAATNYFYALSRNSDYIRAYRVKKDVKWVTRTKYGDLDITINLSKPEKDPKAIAAALQKKQDNYPKCLLCPENEGYAGRLDHPARETIRLIPLTLGGERWYMQYSPYVYYNEHCIVLSGKHVPMKIERLTFVRLMEFLKILPHYTIGSNADLPIVGGSILTHEHFQGGHYTFAMAKAKIRTPLVFKGYADVEAGIVNWPMSVIRLDGENPDRLIDLADRILNAWRGYSDAEAEILAETDGARHNTITPIARMNGTKFELDLVLRNNRTTEQYPLGIFHPHQELHHIKKENIGLIEVMGLAVLPARLLKEMQELKTAMLAGDDIRAIPSIKSHADWADEIRGKYSDINEDNIDGIIRDEIGLVFSKVLEHAGVYKDTEQGRAQFMRFIDTVNRA